MGLDTQLTGETKWVCAADHLRFDEAVWRKVTAHMSEKDPHQKTRASAYELLEKAGFDQLPTGSNCYNDRNLGLTVPFCRKVIAPERLKGFMTAPWCATRPDRMDRFIGGIDQLMDA